MERKLVRQGKSTMTISLPSSWIKRFELNEQDTLEVQEIEKSLIISTNKTFQRQETSIDISNQKKGYVFRKISGLYQSGYDKITIKHNNQQTIISEITNRCIGYTLMKNTSNKCIIEDISGLKDIDFNTIYKRCFTILIEQYKELENLIKKDKSLEDLKRLDYGLNQFTDFALRYLSKRGHESFRKTPLYYYIVSQIELMGDIMTELYLVYDRKEKEQTLKLLKKLNKLIEDFFKFAFKLKSFKNSDIIEDCKEIRNKFLNNKSSQAQIILLQNVMIIKDLFNTLLSLEN